MAGFLLVMALAQPSSQLWVPLASQQRLGCVQCFQQNKSRTTRNFSLNLYFFGSKKTFFQYSRGNERVRVTRAGWWPGHWQQTRGDTAAQPSSVWCMDSIWGSTMSCLMGEAVNYLVKCRNKSRLRKCFQFSLVVSEKLWDKELGRQRPEWWQRGVQNILILARS